MPPKVKKSTAPVMPKPKESCESCRFFMIIGEQASTVGYCRRWPPGYLGALPENQSQSRIDFPVLHGWAWCGEYQNGKPAVLIPDAPPEPKPVKPPVIM